MRLCYDRCWRCVLSAVCEKAGLVTRPFSLYQSRAGRGELPGARTYLSTKRIQNWDSHIRLSFRYQQVERSFGWAARFRRLAGDYERLASTLAGYHWLAFVLLMLKDFFAKSA